MKRGEVVVGLQGRRGEEEEVGAGGSPESHRKSEEEEEGEKGRERISMRGSGKTKKNKKKNPQDILIDRLLSACTMSVYPTFQRANYLLPHESWRSFRPVACAEHQHSSLPARTHCDRS